MPSLASTQGTSQGRTYTCRRSFELDRRAAVLLQSLCATSGLQSAHTTTSVALAWRDSVRSSLVSARHPTPVGCARLNTVRWEACARCNEPPISIGYQHLCIRCNCVEVRIMARRHEQQGHVVNERRTAKLQSRFVGLVAPCSTCRC